MRGKRCAFAIKVDLYKACDKLSWEFIWRTLVQIQLPGKLINVVMHGPTSVVINIKWNGARATYFKPRPGIRQGGPASPYLFVLCMNKLSYLILHAIANSKWKGIKVGKEDPMVSHLMLADDLRLFADASECQIHCVMDTLNRLYTYRF